MSEERQAELTLTPLLVLRHSVAGFAPGAGVRPLGVGAHAPEAEVTLGALVYVWETTRGSTVVEIRNIVDAAADVYCSDGTDFAPSHLRPSADGANPGLQPWQAKEPALFIQIPEGHTLLVAHSLTSAKKTRTHICRC